MYGLQQSVVLGAAYATRLTRGRAMLHLAPPDVGRVGRVKVAVSRRKSINVAVNWKNPKHGNEGSVGWSRACPATMAA
jgi:hypothetical protein